MDLEERVTELERLVQKQNKDLDSFVLVTQRSQGGSGSSDHGWPPVHVVTRDKYLSGLGSSYNPGFDGIISAEDFGSVVESLANINTTLGRLCTLIENSGISLPIEGKGV